MRPADGLRYGSASWLYRFSTCRTADFQSAGPRWGEAPEFGLGFGSGSAGQKTRDTAD
jgi:hypothetical protein